MVAGGMEERLLWGRPAMALAPVPALGPVAQASTGSPDWLVPAIGAAFAISVFWSLVLWRRLVRRARALEQEKEAFRLTFENVATGLAYVSLEGRYIRVNSRFAAMLGYRPEEMAGLHWRAFTHPDDVGEGTRVAKAVLSKDSSAHGRDNRYLHRNGQVVWGRVTVSVAHDETGRPLHYISVVEDVGERREAEQTIRRQRELLDGVIENLPLGVFVKDVKDDYRFVVFNNRMEELLGMDRDEIVGRTDHEIIPTKKEADYYRATDEAVMRGRRVVDIPLEHVTGNRGAVPAHTVKLPVYDEDGEPWLLLGILEDLTERQETERELRESELRYRSLYENMRELVGLHEIVRDEQGRPVDYRILAVNPAYEGALGLKPESVTGRLATDAFGETPPRFIDVYGRVAETGEPTAFEAFLDVIDKHFAISVFSPSKGQFALVASDITALKRAEAERRQLDAQVQHAQKLESLGVLAGGIAHDFNNLLVGILGNADLAMGRVSHVSPVRDHLRDIERAARRAADLCRQMLAYSGKGRFVVEPLDLSELVREMAHMLEVAVAKNVVLRYEFAENLPVVEADATQLRQVVMNLITNASEAVGEKSGVVMVRTGAMECESDYLSETYLDDSLEPGFYAFVEVSDTGCGMDRETLAKIFEPFFTTKFTGRGLGLAAVLGIVRGHRGALKIYSEVGKGTTFRVLLPVVEASVRHTTELAEELGDWRGEGTVLLVDDEETVRAVGKRMLEQVGFCVQVASDGREAVELFEEDGDDIVCVVLDLTMPHMDGEEAFRQLRRLRPKVKVVLSSGYNEQEVINRFAGKGLAGFIQKPYQSDALWRTVKRVLDEDRDSR